MINLQVTLFDKNKKFKPMSTLIKVESIDYYKEHKKELQKRAIANICHQRYLSWQELQQLGYTLIKVREYNKEKIKEQQEQLHRINLIKKIERERK